MGLKQIDSRVFSVGGTGYGVSCIVRTPAVDRSIDIPRIVISFGNY